MKFSNNHQEEFSSPVCAFLCGLMQFTGGIISQTFCMIFLCSINDPINVIVRTMGLGIIADVDGICFRNMPKENRIFLKFDPLKVSVHKRDFNEKCKRTLLQKFFRFFFKVLRIYYASFHFYFLPFVVLCIPMLVLQYSWLI